MTDAKNTQDKQDYKLVPATVGFARVDLGRGAVGFDNRPLTSSEVTQFAITLTTAFAEAVKNGSIEMLPQDPRATQYPAGLVFRATESEAAILNEKTRTAASMFSLRPNGGIGGGPR